MFFASDRALPRWRGCGWTHKPFWRSTTTWSQGTPGFRSQDLAKINGNISKKMTTMETWTFYLRWPFLFAGLSYYFIAVLRLKKSSTLLLAPVLASTQHSSHRKCYWYIFSQNGYFWNSVWPALSSAICHSRGVPTDWEWWFFVTHGGFQLTF